MNIQKLVSFPKILWKAKIKHAYENDNVSDKKLLQDEYFYKSA